jgi:hypothetical protein
LISEIFCFSSSQPVIDVLTRKFRGSNLSEPIFFGYFIGIVCLLGNNWSLFGNGLT